MSKAILELKNVSLKMGEKKIFESLSLQLVRGELHVLLGPNGVGKSSLFKMVAGHPNYRSENGHILLNGEVIDTWLPEKRSQKGIFAAFQDPCEIEGLTVANFLRTILKAFPDNPAYALNATAFYQHLFTLLDQVGLPRNFTARAINCGFSGGEKKRFEWLQLLLLQPKFALLDELDGGLDIDARRCVLRTIQSMRQDPQTGFLVVSHDVDFIRQLNPTVVHVLRHGVLEEVDITHLDKIEAQGYR